MTTQAAPAVQKSTIVRPKRRVVPAQVWAAFATLELIAPSLGARWAERLWFGVPPPPSVSGRDHGSAHDTGLLPPGEPFELSVNGGLVVGEAWGDGPVVYLVHGWGGRRSQLAAFVRGFAAAGHRVVAFDAPSHGESAPGKDGPKQTTFLEFEEALAAVVRRYGPARAVVAHSGGAQAVALAICHGLPVERLVFIAPMANAESYLEVFQRQLGFVVRTREALVRRIVDRVGLPMSHFDIPAAAGAMGSMPLLVVHDRNDAEVGWADGAAIAEAWPGARLISTHGLGHRRILRAPEVVADVVSFVAAP